MGKEILDMSTDEESDCVIICSANESEQQNDSAYKPSEFSGSDEAIEVLLDRQILHGLVDTSEHEVKDYPLDSLVEVSSLCKAEEGPHIENLNSGAGNLEKNKVSCAVQKLSNHVNLESSVKSASKSSNAGTARSKYTVPQPFALATEKRASGATRPPVANYAGNGNKPAQAQTMQKKGQNNSPLSSMKPVQPDIGRQIDEEDVCSIASSTTASVMASKSKFTLGSAPIFRSSERAQKRREYYSKLEEKHQALEAEKSQCAVRTKEEREAALKQLRKSLTFKAKPMPSFYHEGPPPKVELKKLPTTRAKSPKLGRRKSCGDTTNSSHGDKNTGASGRASRHSLSTLKADTNKVQDGSKNGPAACKDKEKPKPAKDGSKSHPQKVTEQMTADITVQS